MANSARFRSRPEGFYFPVLIKVCVHRNYFHEVKVAKGVRGECILYTPPCGTLCFLISLLLLETFQKYISRNGLKKKKKKRSLRLFITLTLQLETWSSKFPAPLGIKNYFNNFLKNWNCLRGTQCAERPETHSFSSAQHIKPLITHLAFDRDAVSISLCWNPRQNEIVDWSNRNNPANLFNYASALHLLNNHK